MSTPEELRKKANKMAKPGVMGFLKGGADWSGAQEAFQQAGNLCKAAKDYAQAAQDYEEAASCSIKAGGYETASLFASAGEMFKRADNFPRAVSCIEESISCCIEKGRFTNAAKHEKELAEMYRERGETDQAVKRFRKAAAFYQGENSVQQANGCLTEVADTYAKGGDYQRGADTFDEMLENSMGAKVSEYTTRELAFKAFLCRMALLSPKINLELADGETAADLSNRYLGQMGSRTRESELCENMTEAFDAGDPDQYASVVADYDSVRGLDSWKTTILLEIKRKLTKPDEAEVDLS